MKISRIILIAAIAAAFGTRFRLAAVDPGPAAPAESLSVAAAANLVYALDALDAEFLAANRNVAFGRSIGASGGLVQQIENGAPYDVFLSADVDFPRKLARDGGAVGASLVVFAYGRLVLWTTKPGLDVGDVGAVVRNGEVSRLAIANPDLAPYGRAARQALERLGLLAEARPKFVIGESIAQTAQFVETGNADAGLVAMSLVRSPKLNSRGRWTEVPAALYDPIEEGAILTARGAANPAARRYLGYLTGAAAQKILQNYGYGVPAPSP